MLDVLTIGDCTIDAFHILDEKETSLVCDRHNEHCRLCLAYADKIPVKEIRRLVAGNAANNAVAMRRLGFETGIYTVIGDDHEGERIRQVFEDEGLGLDYVITELGTESNFHTVLVYRTERTILVHHIPRRYRLPQMQKAGWVYLTSMGEGWESILPDLIGYLDANRAKLVYQPGTFQLRSGARKANELFRRTEVVVMNREEAEFYLETDAGTAIPKLLTGLLALGPKVAVVTDGLDGSYAASAGEAWFLGTRPDVVRVETTGAGDAYASGFTAALIRNRTIAEAMRWGTHNAEGVVGAIGPQTGLRTGEVIELELRKNPTFLPTPVKL